MAALANMNTPLTRRDDRKARREERFFFRIACAMAIVLVSGFSVHLMAGRSSFDVPLVSHLHAAVFFGWIVLFLVQTGLMTSGNIAMHRRLGWLSALWVPVTIALGSTMSLTSLQCSGGPFFFAANDFLLGNIIGLITFGCMVGAALAMRRRSDWHRRLMLRAMASMTGPGFGRLLPMPLLMPFAWEPSNMMGMVFSSQEISTTGRTLA